MLGQPGAGKATSMKKLCLELLSQVEKVSYSFPILINLRELPAADPDSAIHRRLKEIFLFDLAANDTTRSQLDEGQAGSITAELLLAALDELHCLIVMEGFDEIHTSKQKDAALKEIRSITRRLKKTKIVITCRTGEFNYNIDQCDLFEISPLTSQQIAVFSERWIGPEAAKGFLQDLKSSPFSDTAIKPLTLAHLCAIYERIGSIPDRPKTVYRKVVSLLLEEWDEQRSVRRQSSYAGFEPDRKFEFLTHLSYHPNPHAASGQRWLGLPSAADPPGYGPQQTKDCLHKLAQTVPLPMNG